MLVVTCLVVIYDNKPIVWSWQQMVDRDGEEAANTRFATSAKRLLKLTMEPGLFENTYLNLDESLAEAGSKDKKTLDIKLS